ncbi:MAG: DUF3891 family protein [Chloroflexi bacterium]|nr:DUF3891 family protein [Chloroflexota bacterium]
MILRRYRGQLLIVLQTDHGRQCAAFVRHWGDGSCDAPAPREPLLLAAAEHDNGWAEWEAAPPLDPATGQPWQFTELPSDQHIALYRRGIARSAAQDPYGGLLVSMHGVGLYNDRYGTWPRPVTRDLSADQQALVAAYVAEQQALQARLRAAAARDARHAPFASDAAVWHNYKLLQLWDRLSLQFCWRGCTSGTIAPAPLRAGAPDVALVCEGDGEATLRLSPYPFDRSPLPLPVTARLVPDRCYASIEDFLATFAAAEAIEVPLRAVA